MDAGDARPADESLSFDAKLELDQLIDQMMVHAQGVNHVRSRLRALLKAIEDVSGELDLRSLLRHVTEAACELVGARYGALGVVGVDGGLEEFINVGVSDEVVERIGTPPEGRGLLGALINDPHPVRLRCISDDERAAGFPPGHPPMTSFLGVPIRVRGEVFGNLYLTESVVGEFSAEDEEMVSLLAVTAGTAISNARLYSDSKTQQQWLAASVEISANLLSEPHEPRLEMIARRVMAIAKADSVIVTRLMNDGQVTVEVAIGLGAERLKGQSAPAAGTMTMTAIGRRSAIVLNGAEDYRAGAEVSTPSQKAGPVIMVPLIGNEAAFGSLTIVRTPGRPPFDAGEIEMVTNFASQASVALELATAHADRERIVTLQDRNRIASDLNDLVIQRLFAVGLGLQATASRMGSEAELVGQIMARVDEIDETIRQLRSSIADLREIPINHSSGFAIGRPVDGLH